MAITSQARLAALLALAIAGQGLAGCGKKAKHGGDAAHPGSTTVPVITPESLTFTDPDSWSSDTIKTAKVPGATAMALGPYGNCAEYETAFMDHAKLVQAMYLRRFLAWARYNLKEGSFANIPLIPGFNSGASASSAPGAPSAAASDKSMASAPDSTAAESAGKTDGGGNAGAGPTNASDTSAPAASGPKGFETNNQEAAATRVDETDYVKSDGRFTFVAHGDVLRVSDLTGKLLDTLLLINETPRGLHLANGRLVLVTEARNAFFNTSSIGTMAVNDPEYWRHYYEFARHLVWQASQYVQVREFSVGGDGKLTLARQRTVGGYFRDGREVNGIVHVVTQQQLPWSVLATGLALDLHPAYSGFKTDEDIGKYAAAVASDNLIFMHRLMFEQANELTGDHQRTFAAGECKRFNRITTQVPHELDGAVIRDALAQWDTKLAWTLGSVIVPQWFVDYPILPEFNHLIQITSVDLSGGKDDARAFSFGPQFPSIVYGSADKLVTGGANANWEGFFERLKLLSDAETHGVVRITPAPLKNSVASRFDFVVFGLAADGASPAGFGSVPGIPRDQYALDFDADTLRIVVTETTGTEPNQISQILNGNQATPATTSQVALHVVTPAAAGSSEWKAVGRVALPNYSFVRFSESRAVLATGDQIQAVDLRDAAAPCRHLGARR